MRNEFRRNHISASHQLLRGAAKLEFFVAVNLFISDTAALADIVLPACSIFEKDDLVAGMFLQLQRQVVAPEGESKSDLDIFSELAQRMGLQQFFQRRPEDYLREMLDHKDPLLQGITLERLQREDAVMLNRPTAPYVGVADLQFKTRSGRIEIYKEGLVKYGAELPYFREPIRSDTRKCPLCKISADTAILPQPPPDSLDFRQFVQGKSARTQPAC